jgi:predicted ATP-dependent endonuclease of OLD family
MKLVRTEIKNYRSIEDLKLTFEPKCRILVGINESGKTNILDALNLLDPKVESTRRDLREARLQESQITEAYVRFVFDLTELEALEISNSAKKQILSKNYELPIITVSGLDNTLDRFCASQQGLYIADIISGKKRFSVWALKDAQVKPNWKKIGPA